VNLQDVLKGRNGVAIGLGVAVVAGLMLGSGAFALPFRIPFVSQPAAQPQPAPAKQGTAGTPTSVPAPPPPDDLEG